MRWQQGRPTIDAALHRGELQRVAANRAHADVLIEQARKHLEAAASIMDMDPVGAFQLLYDAARKGLSAILENQGLRATSRGGHIAVSESVLAQLDPPLGKVFRPFDRMRRRRNESEYPRPEVPEVTPADVKSDLAKVLVMLDASERLLDEMSPF